MIGVRSRRGASAIEYALIMPAFVLVFFGILEMGWLFYLQASVQESVRHACRLGATIPAADSPQPVDEAEAMLLEGLDLRGIDCISSGHDCTIRVYTALTSPDEMLVCRAWVPYRGLTGLIPGPDYLDAHSYVLMEVQR